MAYPWFSIIAWAAVAVVTVGAMAASVAVWKARSLATPYRGGLIAAIALVAATSVAWIIFVAPVYVD